nr:hypothetical protein [Tanacetum cinerariifolium]
MEYSKRGSILMQEKLKLSKPQGASTPAELKCMQNVPYASAVGSIMNTKDMFLVYGGDLKRELRKSAKQSIFATSSTEAEYIAAFDASKKAVWVRKFISGLGVVPTIKEPISMYCDNTGAIALANESGLTKGARLFRAKVHYLREVIEYGDVKLEKVHTYDNLADPFTKALAFPKHYEHTGNIGMLPACSLIMAWQAPKLSNLKVWGCKALVKQDTLTKPDKLEPRSIKCIFIGYPKETIENSLITQEASGSLEDLEIIQEEDTHPSIDTSLNHVEDNLEIDEPQSDIIPIRRSIRTRHPIDRICLYIDAEEHELGDLGEPTNYKAALLDHESDKWLNAMNMEMQSMKDNKFWVLVELPPNGKTVGSKWLFKKKTDIDGTVHTYKARLVTKGYTHVTPPNLYYAAEWIDYDETFSPVAYIRAIRILIAIAAYYDYEIWQMDVKTAFFNGYLNEEVYMEQPEDVKSYLGRCFAMKDLGEAAYNLEIKIYRDRSRRLSKSQGASAPAELKHMQNITYASAVGSIMYVVRCTRPDVAFAQNVTSRFQQNLGDLHWTTVKNILKYLRNTKNMFLVYGGDLKRELRVSCYTDAGYLTDADDLNSQTGYVFVLNGGVVDWKSAKQNIFATSYAEAEYIAAFDAFKEAVWFRKFISGLGVVPTIEEPISMYCDNT